MQRHFRTICWILSFLLFAGCGAIIQHPLTRQSSSQAQARARPSMLLVTPEFRRFASTWIAHGSVLIIAANGTATFVARAYRWCATDVPRPCDTIDAQGHIESGKREQLRLSRVHGSTAYGTVLTSTFHPAGLAITLTLEPNDTLLYAARTPIALLCGPTAPAGACGA
jgi:hypothetical protein